METSSLSSLPSSSPLSIRSIKDVHSSPRRPDTADDLPQPYRGVKRLPYELREHCMIYFEEELCMLLSSKIIVRFSNMIRCPRPKSSNLPSNCRDLPQPPNPSFFTPFAASCASVNSSRSSPTHYTCEINGASRGCESCFAVFAVSPGTCWSCQW